MFRAANRLRRTPYDGWVFSNAAENGNLENMKWLLENKFPYNIWTFAYAAKNGNIENIKWLLENEFPYNELTFAFAAEGGKLETMKWLLENKFPYDEKTFECAASNGNLENMNWLLENGFPYDENTLRHALEKIIEENGGGYWFNMDMELIKYVEETGGLENIKWLLENEFPYDEYTKKILVKYIFPYLKYSGKKQMKKKKFPYDKL